AETQQVQAEANAALAIKEGERAVKALKGEQVARAKSEFVAYAAQLGFAQRAIQSGQIDEALMTLRRCDPRLCLWEHDFLLRLTRGNLGTGRHTDDGYSVAFVRGGT